MTTTEQPLTLFDLEHTPAPVAEITCPRCHGHGIIRLAQPIPSAPARDTDPTTSHDASEDEPDVRRFRDGSRVSMLLRRFAVADMTAVEAALQVVPETPVSAFEGTRRRVSDLVAAGYVVDSGARRCNPGSDEQSIVWQVTVFGRLALDCLDRTGWSR